MDKYSTQEMLKEVLRRLEAQPAATPAAPEVATQLEEIVAQESQGDVYIEEGIETDFLESIAGMSPSTIKNYRQSLKTFIKEFKNKMIFMTDIVQYIENKKKDDGTEVSMSTKKCHLSAIKKCLEYNGHLTNELDEKIVEYCNILNNKPKEPKVTNEQKTNDELIAKIKSADIPINFKLVFLMCSYHPSVRSCDYCSIKVKDFDKESDNYILKNKVYFNSLFKTKSKRKLVIDLNKDEQKLLKDFMKNNSRTYLLHNRAYSTPTQIHNSNNKVNAELNKHLKKIDDFTFHKFRTLTYQINFSSADIEIIKKFCKIAKQQNHSIDTALTFYC
jgi:integrase